jgi:hypothetical protein
LHQYIQQLRVRHEPDRGRSWIRSSQPFHQRVPARLPGHSFPTARFLIPLLSRKRRPE